MKKTGIGLLLALFGAIACAFPAQAQLADKKVLTLEGAKKVAAAAEAEMKKNGWAMSIAILDDGAHLIYFQRPDEAAISTVQVAQDKANSAALFRAPTKLWADGLAQGRTAIMALKGAMPLEGGVPIMAGGKVVGAIGVSGGLPTQDGQVANAGAAALQ